MIRSAAPSVCVELPHPHQIFPLPLPLTPETAALGHVSALSCASCLFHNSVIIQNVRNLLGTAQDKASIIEDGVNLGCGHVWTHSDS